MIKNYDQANFQALNDEWLQIIWDIEVFNSKNIKETYSDFVSTL